MTASSCGISPAFVSWMIKLVLPTRTRLSPQPPFRRLKRLKSWGLSPKDILFQFISTSVHAFSDLSPPYLLVSATDTRREHGIPAVITWNPNKDVIQLILLMPQPKNLFSALRYCNWTLVTHVQLWLTCPFQYLWPFPSTRLSWNRALLFLQVWFLTVVVLKCISFTWTQFCKLLCSTPVTHTLISTSSLSWCHLQSRAVILLFLYSTHNISIGADEELIVQGYRTILCSSAIKKKSLISSCHLENSLNAQAVPGWERAQRKINNLEKKQLITRVCQQAKGRVQGLRAW